MEHIRIENGQDCIEVYIKLDKLNETTEDLAPHTYDDEVRVCDVEEDGIIHYWAPEDCIPEEAMAEIQEIADQYIPD